MKHYTQRTVIEPIRSYLEQFNLEPGRLEYRKNRVVAVHTANGLYVFSYDNEFKLLNHEKSTR